MVKVGVDETGRGSMVGRLYVGAALEPDEELAKIVTDSKKLSEKKLQVVRQQIIKNGCPHVVEWADMDEVDEYNPTQATIRAWHRALDKLWNQGHHFDKIVVDGTQFKPYTTPNGLLIPFITEPKADLNHPCVSTASIMAKSERDLYVLDLVRKNPILEPYGIAKNKGYPSKVHRDKLRACGKTAYHRKTYNLK